VRVCNTFNPGHPARAWWRIKTQRARHHQGHGRPARPAAGHPVGRGMLGVPGVAGRIFSAAATTGISVPLIIESTSEQSICFAVPKNRWKTCCRPCTAACTRSSTPGQLTRPPPARILTSSHRVPRAALHPRYRRAHFQPAGAAAINVLAISYGDPMCRSTSWLRQRIPAGIRNLAYINIIILKMFSVICFLCAAPETNHRKHPPDTGIKNAPAAHF